MSVTLATLKSVLCGASPGDQGLLQDSSYYAGIAEYINDAVTAIAAGVRMPDRQVSPPLPDLYLSDTVTTVLATPYVALPATYQRHLFMVSDSSGVRISPPRGGGYYSFALLLRNARLKDLSQEGLVSVVCVKGLNLYYQGIPTAETDITINFYRKPVEMVDDTDEVDGLPDHLAKKLIKHHVAKEIFGEGIEDGEDNRGVGYKFHTAKFFEAMTDLTDHVGIDAEPEYYSSNSFQDLGVCD
ncbi:MAG TPA: hypothetical protein ENH07_10405 [Nitrospirae bacterium]|nr:hypothetical protein [Nitrospirota bacterium]